MALRSNKILKKDGYDITRLVSPEIEYFNDDLLCALCQSKFTYIILTFF